MNFLDIDSTLWIITLNESTNDLVSTNCWFISYFQQHEQSEERNSAFCRDMQKVFLREKWFPPRNETRVGAAPQHEIWTIYDYRVNQYRETLAQVATFVLIELNSHVRWNIDSFSFSITRQQRRSFLNLYARLRLGRVRLSNRPPLFNL